MNVPLIVAGSLAILGTAIHGVGGEPLVVRKRSPGLLPSSPFGGPTTTKLMIHVTWHTTTIAFLTVGLALLLSGSVLHGDTARGLGLVGAGASTGFAAVAVGLGASYARSPRFLLRHPGAAMLMATAARRGGELFERAARQGLPDGPRHGSSPAGQHSRVRRRRQPARPAGRPGRADEGPSET